MASKLSDENRNALVKALRESPFEPKHELDKLKLAYADAMWNWAHVEAAWLPIYICATNSFWSRFSAIQKSFFSIVSARTRLDMTHVASTAAWDGKPEHQATYDRWALLAERSRKELKTRGRIAHLTGAYVLDIPHGKKPPVARLVQHGWHPDHSRKYEEQKNKGTSIDQLKKMAADWNDLSKDLDAFFTELSEPIFKEDRERRLARLQASSAPVNGLGLFGEPQALPTPIKPERQPRPSRKSPQPK